MNWTLIFSFFRTLSLAHLERSLYSLSRQTVKPPHLLFFDNNSPYTVAEIESVIAKYWTVDLWSRHYAKHGDGSKTLAWGNNQAIRLCDTEIFMFCRADYIYDFRFFERMLWEYADNPMHYATAWMWGMQYLSGATHETVDHAADLEPLNWRDNPQNLLAHSVGARPEQASHVDGPTFCTSKKAMAAGGWYDETLTGWGFDQQDLQSHMARNGVQMRVIPEFLYFHMEHGGARDMVRAKQVWLRSPRRLPEILAEEARLKALEKPQTTRPRSWWKLR